MDVIVASPCIVSRQQLRDITMGVCCIGKHRALPA